MPLKAVISAWLGIFDHFFDFLGASRMRHLPDFFRKHHILTPGPTLCSLATMGAELKPTLQLLRVTKVFIEAKGYKATGADIMKATKLPSGTVYPMLSRMETAGWVRAEWEDVDPSEAGRPRRRFYFLTGAGQRAANTAFIQSGVFAAWSM